MRVIFCTSKLPGAVLIRAVTWSDWSHVALIDGDNVIEATWPAVCVTQLADVIAKHSAHCIVDMPCEDPAEVIAAARSQVGKPYDVVALFGILAHRKWQAEDSWFCSELVAWAFDKGGSPLFRSAALHRVTPQHLWILAPNHSGKPADTDQLGRHERP